MSHFLSIAGILLIVVSLASCILQTGSTKDSFSGRYGGGGNRFRPRPPAHAPAHHQHQHTQHHQNFVSVPVPSPTHAYPTFVRVPVPSPAFHPVRFPTNQHSYQQAAPPKQPAYQYQPTYHVPSHTPQNVQYTYYAQSANQQPSYAPSYAPSHASQTSYQVSTNQQASYVPAPSYQTASSTNQQQSYYVYPPTYQSSSSNQQTSYVPIYQSSNQQLSYQTPSTSHTNVVSTVVSSEGSGHHEPCTNAGWTPIAPVGPAPVQSTGTNFRYQQDSSNNRVVVLSPEVIKNLMSMSSTQKGLSSSKHQTTVVTPTFSSSSFQLSSEPVRGHVDNSVSGSSSSASVISPSSINQQQPSVKLVGYIGAASDKTPPGYIQLPVTKTMLRQLGGNSLVRQVETDFQNTSSPSFQQHSTASASDTYSLFTLKSANDIQQLLSFVQEGSSKPQSSSVFDMATSESQNVPMGLVVSNNQGDSNLFGSSGGSGASIQLVGHVSASTPDVKKHFSRRVDDVKQEPRSLKQKS